MHDYSICGGIFDLEKKENRIKELQELMEQDDFWQDPNNAKVAIAESNSLKLWVVPYRELKRKFDAVKELLPEISEEEDPKFFAEMLNELTQVDHDLADLEIRKMLSGEMDGKNCYLSINSGAGGTESCDWALMLSRMYQRWAARRGWTIETLDTVEGDVAGIKSITFRVSGPFAYGYCKAEKGVHRLVRISPFDANAKRHTSFASVDVVPEIDDDIEVDVRPDEVRVDTYRASGAGGQHVNKTDSAVRMTHMPTGIIVSCQSERSQIQNRETCLKMLKARIYEMKREERDAKLKAMGGEKKEIAWGNQIRNYVFQPYTLVKDTRTKFEMGDIHRVMDGDIDPFVNAYLKEFG